MCVCVCVTVKLERKTRLFSSVCMHFGKTFEYTSCPQTLWVLQTVPSPVHDAVPVQGHEVHLAAASRPH